jgi:hypothetical protein
MNIKALTDPVLWSRNYFFGSGSGFHKVPAPAAAKTCEHNFFTEKLNIFL